MKVPNLFTMVLFKVRTVVLTIKLKYCCLIQNEKDTINRCSHFDLTALLFGLVSLLTTTK